MLDRVAIDRSHSYRGRPLVMLLVDMTVHEAIVQQSMGVVETNLLGDNKHGQLEQDPMECGQVTDWSESPGTHRPIAEQGEGDSHEELIDQHRPNHLHQPLPVHRFVGLRLHFVLAQELWPIRDVQEDVQAAEAPVDEGGEDCCAVHPESEVVLT